MVMLFYFALFLLFFYYKVARVYKKEEQSNMPMHIQNFLVFLAAIALFVYGFIHYTWYVVLLVAYIFYILNALLVSAIQLGVFIDGKPFVKLSHLYKVLAFVGMFLYFSNFYLWGI
jgi:hypothetical protein